MMKLYYDKFNEIIKIANILGYNHAIVSNEKQKKIINLYFSDKISEIELQICKNKFLINTIINHPKQGRTELQRNTTEIRVVVAILCNPRVHTHQIFNIRKAIHTYRKEKTWEEKMMKKLNNK